MLSKPKHRKSIIYTLPVVIILFGLVFLVGKASWNTYGKMQESSERRAQAEAELDDVLSRYDELQKKVDYLETDKGVEEEIRTKFNVAREGEKVFVIVGDEKEIDTTDVERGFFSGLWHKIFK